MITADQLVAHLVGDYILQSDWMASKKRTESIAAAVHALVYSLPFFLLLSCTPWNHQPGHEGGHGSGQWLVIVGTHFLIDRYGLARYVVWAKNFLAPRWIQWVRPADIDPAGDAFDRHREGVEASFVRNLPWAECSATGYPPDRPPFLAVWLLIIGDNVLHILINGLALRYL